MYCSLMHFCAFNLRFLLEMIRKPRALSVVGVPERQSHEVRLIAQWCYRIFVWTHTWHQIWIQLTAQVLCLICCYHQEILWRPWITRVTVSMCKSLWKICTIHLYSLLTHTLCTIMKCCFLWSFCQSCSVFADPLLTSAVHWCPILFNIVHCSHGTTIISFTKMTLYDLQSRLTVCAVLGLQGVLKVFYNYRM